MKEIVESYFQQRSLVNHQLASYNDCIPSTDGKLSRMEKIVRNIRIGTDEPIEDDDSIEDRWEDGFDDLRDDEYYSESQILGELYDEQGRENFDEAT